MSRNTPDHREICSATDSIKYVFFSIAKLVFQYTYLNPPLSFAFPYLSEHVSPPSFRPHFTSHQISSASFNISSENSHSKG